MRLKIKWNQNQHNMQQITLSFTPDELRELAKQLYLGRFFLTTCDYDNREMANDIFNRVCEAGYEQAPETGGFRHPGPESFEETFFTISSEMDDECTPVIELYGDCCIQEYLPYKLADRDFEEQYQAMDPELIFNDPELLNALQTIQKKYLDEFETYGVIHLRLD